MAPTPDANRLESKYVFKLTITNGIRVIESELKVPMYVLLVSFLVLIGAAVTGAILDESAFYFVALTAVCCWSVLTTTLTVLAAQIIGSIFDLDFGLLKPMLVKLSAVTLTSAVLVVPLFAILIVIVKMGVIEANEATDLPAANCASLLVLLTLVYLPFRFFGEETGSPILLVMILFISEILSGFCIGWLLNHFFLA